MNMSLSLSDFLLTDDELARLNRYISVSAEKYASEGELASEVAVTFTWMVGFGRCVTANFGGSTVDHEISGRLA